MRPPNTVILGHVCIDHNKAEHATYTSWGGALYIPRYFQDHFGSEPAVITSYGPDFEEYIGSFMLYPDRPNMQDTLVFENVMEDGKRTQYAHNINSSPEPPTDGIIELIENAEILFVATFIPNYSADYVKEVLSHARPSCLKVLIVQGYLRSVGKDGLVGVRDFPESKDILPNFDIAVFSDEDHPNIEELASKWKKESPSTQLVMTQGAKGASIIEEDGPRNIPTTPIPQSEIIDSVGCGDVFTAALAYHYFKGGDNDIASAIAAAHRAARRKLLATNATDNVSPKS